MTRVEHRPPDARGLDLILDADRPAMVHASRSAAPTAPMAWLSAHRDALRAVVSRHGAVLIRGLDVHSTGAVFAAAQHLVGELMTEQEGFAPRVRHPGGVYSGSTWPADERMCPHNELSYAQRFPGLMLFACLVAPSAGGAINLADCERVLAELPPALAAKFGDQGWSLRRRYSDLLSVGWAAAIGAGSRVEAEQYCKANQIEFEWAANGDLCTVQRRPAIVAHPVTGRRCWFNQIAFLSEWTMDPEIRAYLLAAGGPGGLPFGTARGDGQPIGPEIVELLHRAYEQVTVRAQWQAGDLLLVDNVRMAHGREPYQGHREILVAMGSPVRLADRTAPRALAGTR